MSQQTEQKNQAESKNLYQKRATQFLLLCLICLLLGLIDGLRSYTSAYYDGVFFLDFWTAIRWDMMGWAFWIPFIPLVLWLCRRFPLSRDNWLKGLLIFLPIGSALAVAHAIFPILVRVVFFNELEYIQRWLPKKPLFLVTDFVIGFVFFALILSLGQAINYYKRYREGEVQRLHLEAQLSKAQLTALKMQLQPHFLFNALNSISALQLENVEAAQEMTARLGDFLRMTLENAGTQEVSLEREIEFLRCYLEIEQVRFGRRLSTNIEVAPEISGARVPNLILQPLVENALKHGIAPNNLPGKINIRAARENGWVKVEVRDNGKGIRKSPNEIFSAGLGLSNTQARLQQLYGENFRLDLKNAQEGGLQVTLRLPHKPSNGENII